MAKLNSALQRAGGAPPETMQTRALASRDLSLLAYAQHMAETAQSEAAKHLFEAYVKQERDLLEALTVTGNGSGGPHVAPQAFESVITNKGGTAVKKSASKTGKKVSFEFKAEPDCEVFVAGTFNNWEPKQHQMRDNPDSGHYKTTLSLPPGRHEYKFVVNGQWRLDTACPVSVPNNHGSLNSVISV
jgi:hypothetical protein